MFVSLIALHKTIFTRNEYVVNSKEKDKYLTMYIIINYEIYYFRLTAMGEITDNTLSTLDSLL